MVTPDAPVSAVNKAHTASPTTASPAGIQPNNAWVSAISRFDVFDADIR